MAKCVDCGFLALRGQGPAYTLYEADLAYRKSPFPRGDCLMSPECFVRALNLEHEIEIPSATGVLTVLQKERECSRFTPWQQGYSPKDHNDMIHEAELRKLQQDQRERDLRFQEEMRDKERQWQERQTGTLRQWRNEDVKIRDEEQRIWQERQDMEQRKWQETQDAKSLRQDWVKQIIIALLTAALAGLGGYLFGSKQGAETTLPAITNSLPTMPVPKK